MVKKAPNTYRATMKGLKNSVTFPMVFMPPTMTNHVQKASPTPDIQGFIPNSDVIATAIELDCTIGMENSALQPIKRAYAPASQVSFKPSRM